MSRFAPQGEFVKVWQESSSVLAVSLILKRQRGYAGMTARTVHRWAVTFRQLGVKLKRMPEEGQRRRSPRVPKKEKVSLLLQELREQLRRTVDELENEEVDG